MMELIHMVRDSTILLISNLRRGCIKFIFEKKNGDVLQLIYFISEKNAWNVLCTNHNKTGASFINSHYKITDITEK